MPCSDEGEAFLRQLALIHLGAIGVSGEPPDPEVAFAELDADKLHAAWLSGAVQPISIRGLAAGLLARLSQEASLFLVDLFLLTSREDRDEELPRSIQAIQKLYGTQFPELDKFFDEPVVSINPAATEVQVLQALNPLLAEWKQRENFSERRDRSEKFDRYFEVWDLREGWTGSGYDRRRDRPLKEIARTLMRPLSTVGDQYLRAFELVTGHCYRRELWFRLFGPLKVQDLVLHPDMAKADIRPLKSPSPRPVSESLLHAGQAHELDLGGLSSAVRRNRELDVVDLRMDVESLLTAGATTQEILKSLNLPEIAIELVEYLRQRGDVPDRLTAE